MKTIARDCSVTFYWRQACSDLNCRGKALYAGHSYAIGLQERRMSFDLFLALSLTLCDLWQVTLAGCAASIKMSKLLLYLFS